MVSSILVPLDGSQLAERALPHAVRLACSTSARIVLTWILPVQGILTHPEADQAAEQQSRRYLRHIADDLSARGIQVESVVNWSVDPATGILEQVETTQADLIGIATHGRSGPGRWLYGSVADAVLRHARVPVLLVPPEAGAPWPADQPPRILVALDGSELAEAGLAPVEALARPLGAEVILVQVVRFPPYALYGDGSMYLSAYDPSVALAESDAYLKDVAAHFRIEYARVLSELGQPATAIAEIAQRENADLIAMATHGRGGLARLVLGSVATGTLQRASMPLLLVRPPRLHHEVVDNVLHANDQSNGVLRIHHVAP